MPDFIRSFFRSALSAGVGIFVITQLFGGVQLDSIWVAFIAGVVFTLLSWVLKPVLNILLLPFNIVTLGLFSWVIHVIVLYLVDIFVPGFTVRAVVIPAFSIGPISILPIEIAGVWSYLAFAFILSIIQSFVLLFI